jgi:hypothetical protein
MAGVLNDVKNVTNWLICLDLLCIPAENTWVYSIDVVSPTDMVRKRKHLQHRSRPIFFFCAQDPMTSITFLVTLWSDTTEVLKNASGCKRHVAEYLGNYGSYSERWKVPLKIPGVGCTDDLDFEVPANVITSHSRCAANYKS